MLCSHGKALHEDCVFCEGDEVQSELDALRADVERLTKERDAAEARYQGAQRALAKVMQELSEARGDAR